MNVRLFTEIQHFDLIIYTAMVVLLGTIIMECVPIGNYIILVLLHCYMSDPFYHTLAEHSRG